MSAESRKAKRAPEWGIAVRLADGSLRYYCLEGGIQGQWGVHESQALDSTALPTPSEPRLPDERRR